MNRRSGSRQIFLRYRIAWGLVICFICCPVQAEVPQPSVTSPIGAAFVRFEVVPMDSGAELLTLFFTDNPDADVESGQEVPLITVLRDTLGSSDPAIHRLRYVWVHTNASPGLKQRIAAATPFVYSRVGNTRATKNGKSKPVMDLSEPEDRLWKNLWGIFLKGAIVDPKLSLLESAIQTYGENRSLYLEAQLARASTAIDMEDSGSGSRVLTDSEKRQLQQRFASRTNEFAPLLNEKQLERFYLKEMLAMRQACGRNWELLRQRAEAEGLYFEPLLLPDGTATHALLWVAREDLSGKRPNRFDDRFLSIGSPWGDKALLDWKGATEFRYFDSEDRRVRSAAEGTRRGEMIPLALYGLDHPKIPVLLIDFRKPLNAKTRELSRRVVEEIGDKVSTGSALVNLMIRIGRTAAGVVTRRIGVDFLQPSRMVSYSQLKMVLSSNPGLSPDIRSEIARRLEFVAFNPLENDLATEVKLARSQYEALLSFAEQPEGLRIDLERDRRAELTASAHGGVVKFALRLGGVLSFGLYRHREKETTELDSLLAAQRRDINDRRFLDAVVRSGKYVDVQWDSLKVREVLRQASASKSLTDDALADTAFKIFEQTQDDDTRLDCLATLYSLDTARARQKLTRIAENQSLDTKWRALSASYLSESGNLRLIANIDDGRGNILSTEGND